MGNRYHVTELFSIVSPTKARRKTLRALRKREPMPVDEQFGAAILRDAAAQGFTTACPAGKSGQDEFDFEYGDDSLAMLSGAEALRRKPYPWR